MASTRRCSSERCRENVGGTTCADSRDGERLPEENHAKIDAISHGYEGARLEEKLDLESAGGDRNCRAEGSRGSCRRSSHGD